MMLKQIKRFPSKILSACLCFALLVSVCFVPGAIPTQAASYFYEKIYDFSANSGIQYGNIYVEDSDGTERQISRGFFSQSENEALKIFNDLQETGAGTSGYLFNDASGLFELKPDTAYSVSLKLKVVSSQQSFDKNGVSYPVSSQITELKLAYGMPATYAANKITTDTEIGMLAKVGTETTTFTATQNGSDVTYNVGQWYTLTYDFTTPETFGENGNVLGLALKSFNGVHILVDDVTVQMMTSIVVDPGVGTISQTSFPHKIGDKINIENPTYKFGYDFEGWFTDKACTNRFTDEYVTEENCNITLYAGWSDTHFGFEGYTPIHPTFGFSDHFYDIIEDETAPQGKNVLYYHYTEEYWNQIRSGSVEEGNAVYYSSRRTQRENNISLKVVKPNTDYVITFKYKIAAGSGDVYAFPATGANNIWIPDTYVEYLDTRMLITDDNPDVWLDGRLAFTTGDLPIVGGATTDYATVRLYAVNHTKTEIYIDDIRIEAVEGDASVELLANGGAFKDGSSSITQKTAVGELISSFEIPVREDYDFDGWYLDKKCTTPITSDKVDGSVYLNKIYAGWTRDMGFEGYYYDLESPDRNNYLSDNVTIVKENPQKGNYSAKLVNNSSNKQNVIALNPIANKTRYLVTFYYNVETCTAPVNVKFATMNYNINNSSEVAVYDEIYSITSEDAGKGYQMGAVIIETDFSVADSNRLAMLVSSDTASDYTVYFDSVSVTSIEETDGYVMFVDNTFGEHKAGIGTNGKEIDAYEPSNKTAKFLGWYTDEECTELYEGGYKYSDSLARLYASWAEGEGFENYNSPVSGVETVTDPDDKDNKYLSVTGNVNIKIADAEIGKKYGVELSYSLLSGSAAVTIGGETCNISTGELGTGWRNHTVLVTATETAIYLNVSPSSGQILIDNLIVYEINDYMSVITFDQKDGYGEDCVRIGVRGLEIDFPAVPINGDNVFYGWYADSSLANVFSLNSFPAEDTVLYARWATNPITIVNFDDLDADNLPFNETNSNTVYLCNKYKKDGTYSIAFDRESEEEYDTYLPLANAQGYITLESNTTYAVSFSYYFPAHSSSYNMKFRFFGCSTDGYNTKTPLSSVYTVNYATTWRTGYTYITTGDLDSTNNVLYVAITGGNKTATLYLDAFKFTRVDEGRNHIFLYEDKDRKVYEIDGNVGSPIDYPNIDTNQYVIEGWYNDQEVTDLHTEGTHKNEKVSFLYGRWELNTVNFDNYLFESSNSKYTVGDDISLSTVEAYDTTRSLKYSYNYAVNYFETSNNAASIGRVNDNSTYRISFYYKLTEAQGDVDIKFLTAHINNRWSFITDYDEATYTVYSGEVGAEWKKATVYLTTKFVHLGTSGLFFTFNPRVEGDTVLYVDAVRVEYLGSNAGVAAFIGKDGNAVMYKESGAGNTVSVPETVPAAQFAAFNGWYSDEQLTDEVTSVTLNSGMNYVYSSWTEKAETFANYTYNSNNADNYAQNNEIVDGKLKATVSDGVFNGLRLGKIDNNTSYKVIFDYKASKEAKIKFASADEMSILENATYYNDKGNFAEVSGEGSATVYFTSSFAYTVPKDANVNATENKNADFGDMLYMCFEAENGAEIFIDNIALKEVEALYSGGASVLTEEASKEVGSQALRFFFSYPTTDIINVNIDGETMNVVERGIIFKNARNTATGTADGDLVKVSAITLENKDKSGHTYISKTNKFNEYWDYDNKTESLVFSGYIKDFNLKDARLIGARAYILLKDAEGNIYTFYSADKKTTVKEGVEINSEITDVDVHTLSGVTWDNYTIVNPKLMPYIYGQQIEFLMEYAKTTHKVEIPRVTEKAEETAYEIVIGDTKREASDLITVENEDQYVIAVRGTKIIIKGGSDLATMQGVKDFIEYLKLKDSLDCGADLKDGYTKYGEIAVSADDYSLTFNDEFNGSLLDRNVWGPYNSEKYPHVNSVSQLGGDVIMYVAGDQGYTTATGRVVEEPVFVRDGNAVITCARLNDTDFSFNRMSSFWNMIYQYGMLEFNIKLPEHPVHVSLWMNGAATGNNSFTQLFGRESRGCMTEYDLIETYGKYNYFAANIHHWWSSTGVNDRGHVSLDGNLGAGEKNQTYIPDSDEMYLYDNYHIFTFLWNNDSIVFAVDGVKFYEYKNTPEYYDRMPNYIIVGAGMGNRDYGSPYDINAHKDYYETHLDYVRLYQIENMGSILRWANNNPNYKN